VTRSTSNTTQRTDTAQQQLGQKIETLRGQLRVLEEQLMHFGAYAPAHKVLERDTVRDELARAEAELEHLASSATQITKPYLGLATFQAHDAALFFGRDELIADLVERIRRAPFLAVLGASGSGKSSVVRAGLLPKLQEGTLAGSDGWRYIVFKPGPRPLDTLAAELVKLQGGDLTAVLTLSVQLAANERALLSIAEVLLDRAHDQRLVLVVDQFEELWSLLPTEQVARETAIAQQQKPFIDLLLHAVSAPDSPLLLIVTMRADFLHRAAEQPQLAHAIVEHDVIVSPLTEQQLRDAIERPAELAGGGFEPGLAEELIKQVRGRQGALPLLQYTLEQLWERHEPDGTLTWAAFNDLGGVEGALAARADKILSEHYTSEQQEIVRRLLLKLIQPGEGAADTRRRVPLNELASASLDEAAVQQLLKPLTDERLVTTGRDDLSKQETVEITHEALIRGWPTLAGWIEAARADLRLQLQLDEAAREWETNNGTTDLLWSGLRLSNAEEWLKRTALLLNERSAVFLNASRLEAQRRAEADAAAERDRQQLQEEQRHARRLHRLLVGAAVLLSVAVFASVIAVKNQRAAVRARRAVEQQRSQALQARAEAERERRRAEAAQAVAEHYMHRYRVQAGMHRGQARKAEMRLRSLESNSKPRHTWW
jgi:energy-coupling factor transporter ATP-binding protein EcfA2